MVSKDKLKLDIEIPFCTRTGNQLGYPEYSHEMKKNRVFEDTLYYDSYGRGMSSIKFYFKDSQDVSYQMFAKDFSELVKNKCIVGGIKGNWSFRKQGSNYGLTYVVDINE